ncbi:type IV pilus assembly protein PilB [Venenivibrio stagnispumantis]|uniref:Type IV pilus assembly protein PilB n=1 Tax=Venenivibrio stagnispumantis TaxID=407998 RepID=A0AA45WIJ4_9AQUI|nr:GspE/PulE family protein [Venenivibrio stagnispumantis]SMP00533.1 type IV pilus assembly protein PilB [Venenivibrio stagnispumantis]
MEKKPIGELLKEFGYINDEQIAIALKVKEVVPNKLFGEILKELSFVSSAEVSQALALQTKKEFINLLDVTPPKEVLKLVPKDIALQFEILPIDIKDNKLVLAVADPFNLIAFDLIKRRTNLELQIYVADRDMLLKNIQLYYFLLENPIEDEFKKLLNQIKAGQINIALPNLVDNIINAGIINKASDIHIVPENLATHVFYRIDGVLQHYFTLPSNIHQGVISRIKILAGLDIAEQRLPQDGSFSHKFLDEYIDLRVSTVPTEFGENAVLRILSKNLSLFNLRNLGLEEWQVRIIERNLEKPQGIFLLTGPTGSGKTTTLYSSLRKINALKRNIITVEDPIEYKFPFIKQTEVNEKAGYTFSKALRAFLRQDPDVILLGEMRDEETAEMAIRAAITGHLVLSTIHTNSAVMTIPRLLDMKIKPYMIASALNIIISQRLARKVCNFCKERKEITKNDLITLGFNEDEVSRIIGNVERVIYYEGKGCEHCRNTGYSGRIVVAEILEIDRDLAEMIEKEDTIYDIQNKAIQKGMKTIREVGLLKVLKGITTPQEIIRVTG